MKQKKEIIKPSFTDKSDIRLGFEVECVIYGDAYQQFCSAIHRLRSRTEIGSDGSIRWQAHNRNGVAARGVELRTPPLPPKQSMELLERVFNIVNRYGLTNKSCGFHVNISSKNKTKMKRFNPFTFLHSKIWRQILSTFKRRRNGYCSDVKSFDARKTSKVEYISNCSSSLFDKYKCVNLNNWNGINATSRVEIRGFGNKDYTKKIDVIAPFVKRIEKLFDFSCSNDNPFFQKTNI